jgi:hypothetical protein
MTNLLVKDIMKILAITTAFDHVKEVNKFFKDSPIRIGLLQHLAAKEIKVTKVLQLPGQTR